MRYPKVWWGDHKNEDWLTTLWQTTTNWRDRWIATFVIFSYSWIHRWFVYILHIYILIFFKYTYISKEYILLDIWYFHFQFGLLLQVANESDAIVLKFGLTLQQIMDVVSLFLSLNHHHSADHGCGQFVFVFESSLQQIMDVVCFQSMFALGWISSLCLGWN